jgi:hypothetical protein
MIMKTSKRKKLKKRLLNRYGRYAMVAVLMGIVGVSLIRLGFASSNAGSVEAESGNLSGAAVRAIDETASGGQTVVFGAIAPPVNLQAITGGDSIALVWDMPTYGVKNVEVYRNDVKVATVTPYSGVLRAERLGTRYIDRDVNRGATYKYKVRIAISATGTSPFTAPVSATHPINTTPVPAITIDSRQAPDLADYLTTYAKREIETWYPKIADAIAYPAYAPPKTIQIVTDENSPHIASATGTKITVKPSWLRPNFYDGGGAFLHEATHVIQSYPNGSDTSGWATEGIADWTRDWFTRERFYIPRANEQLGSYSPGGLAAAWGEAKYNSGFVRRLNIALHNRTYNANFVTNQTGRSAQQLFTEAKQAHYGSTGVITNGDGKCLDIEGNSPIIGFKLQLMPCNEAIGRQWTAVYHDAGLHGSAKKTLHFANTAVAPDGRCLEVNNNGLADGTFAIPNNCTWSYNQEWVKQEDGSLKSPYSGKCLAPLNDNPADGTQIVIATCNGHVAQRWTVPN